MVLTETWGPPLTMSRSWLRPDDHVPDWDPRPQTIVLRDPRSMSRSWLRPQTPDDGPIRDPRPPSMSRSWLRPQTPDDGPIRDPRPLTMSRSWLRPQTPDDGPIRDPRPLTMSRSWLRPQTPDDGPIRDPRPLTMSRSCSAPWMSLSAMSIALFAVFCAFLACSRASITRWAVFNTSSAARLKQRHGTIKRASFLQSFYIAQNMLLSIEPSWF